MDKTNSQTPTQKQLSSLLEFYNNGNFDNAEQTAKYIIKNFPKHPFAWKVLSAIFKETGRNMEALKISEKIVELSPQDLCEELLIPPQDPFGTFWSYEKIANKGFKKNSTRGTSWA